jgi:hypothetical protein
MNTDYDSEQTKVADPSQQCIYLRGKLQFLGYQEVEKELECWIYRRDILVQKWSQRQAKGKVTRIQMTRKEI